MLERTYNWTAYCMYQSQQFCVDFYDVNMRNVRLTCCFYMLQIAKSIFFIEKIGTHVYLLELVSSISLELEIFFFFIRKVGGI